VVLDIIRTGYLAAAADQDRALEILAKVYPETDRVVEAKGLALLADLWTQADPGFGLMIPANWQAFATWMITQELLPAGFSMTGAIGANIQPTPTATPLP
jgi:hypothetical protein